ncbi:DUF6221 family protein [Nonomuraea sp. NPDC050404]|uniref:DUF6221 family protein n=1 Tax=Nonomuraea sp. NPDC050404 TaxID=3155783 RepID=UPI0033F7C0DD
MDDLAAFLRARLDEDEQLAREAGNRHWLVQDNTIELYPEHEDDGYMRWPTRADARHAANWEPARVLREVEAKRRIVERCERDLQTYIGTGVHVATSYLVLRMLALPHAEHPDYLEAWKP